MTVFWMAQRRTAAGFGPNAAIGAPGLPRPTMRRAFLALVVCVSAAMGHGAVAMDLGDCGDPQVETARPTMPTRDIQVSIHQDKLRLIEGDYDTVLVGDSLVQFWPDDLASRALSAKRLLNFGVGLDRTQHVLWRLQSPGLETLHPRLVVLLVGTNNLKAGDDACAITTGIKAVAGRIRSLWPRAKLILIGIPARGPGFAFRDDERRAINDSLRPGAGSDRDWSFVDTDASLPCGSEPACDTYLSDNLHLSQTGYAVLGALLKEQVTRRR